MKDTKDYRIKSGSKVDLKDFATRNDGGLHEDDGRRELAELQTKMTELQQKLYAEARQSLLIIFQAMDTGGKDNTIGSVLTPLNPLGVRVVAYKAPNATETRHDFLWRIHQNMPGMGHITVFNRSHYEDVLVVRVKELAPEKRWKARYEHINHFEEMLHDEGTRIVKFYLHISKEYQKKRLQRRLEIPAKQWKFNPGDLEDRKLWKEFQHAYEDALERCSTEHAPWYVIPAEVHWFRNLLVARVLVETLESMDPKYPKPTFDPKTIVIE
jgi:PPK2 family polyphosphate:nucleotide phosphotransferase